MKGQTLEMLGFLILAIAVLGVILFLRSYLIGGFSRTFLSVAERHEFQGFKGGVNSILFNTETKTGKKLLELLGIVAHTGNPVIYFGPTVGSVDIRDEITWRFDAIYGKGKWFFHMPYPDIIPLYQTVIIVDTSASICDDVENMRDNLPKLIEDLRQQGFRIGATVYLLPGGQQCCGGIRMTCEGANFQETRFFHCRDFRDYECKNRPRNEEDWGNGLACAIEIGPEEEWRGWTAKIGIILSDELSSGSECGGSQSCCRDSSSNNGLQTATSAAQNFGMYVFPIKAETCKPLCFYYGGQRYDNYPPGLVCDCDSLLTEDMQRLASTTGGRMAQIQDSTQVTDVIRSILTTINIEVEPHLNLGTEIPKNKNIRAVTIPVPVSYIGEYTNAYIYQWS